ncbi:MAG: hypothetical protein Q8M29_03980 [Bacteroidota bacterium]|nr:hypothetical protein [Bacteroidota bacterium]
MIWIVLSIAFLLRITPRLVLPYAITDDGYSHYEDINILYKNRLVPPQYYTKAVLKQLFGYPYGLMYLFILIPKKLHLAFEILISPLSDTLMIYVAYRFFKYFTFMNQLEIDETYFCLFAGVLATYSIYLRNDSGPRAYHGSSRVISQLFFVCINYAFYLYYNSGDYMYLGISIIFGFLLILFSIFGTQVLFLSSVVIVCSGIWMYSLIPLGSLLLFYLLTWRKGHQMIVARIWHYEWYFKFFQHVHLAKWKFLSNPLVDYFKTLKGWFKLALRFNLKSLIIYFNIYNSPIHLLVASYFCYFFIFNTQTLVLKESYFVMMLTLGCLLAFVATLFRKLLFLGESYRYLEFGVTFAMVLFFTFIYSYREIAVYFISAWIFIGLIRYVFYQVEFFKKYRIEHTNYNKYKTFFAKINPLIEGNVYASAHFRTKGAFFGNFKYIALRGMQSIRIESIKSHQLAFGNYPMPDFNYKEMVNHFDLNYWLTTNKEFDAYRGASSEHGDIKDVTELVHEDKELGVLLLRINRTKLKL